MINVIVSNATPLIYLARIGRLDLLKTLFREIHIPKEVKEEVIDNGKLLGKKDAYIIEQAVKIGWIIVEKPKMLETHIELHEGEASAIALATQLKAEWVLLDESKARTAAKLLGNMPLGTVGVLLLALQKKKITYEEFLASLESLIKEGFRLGSDVFAEIVSSAEKFK